MSKGLKLFEKTTKLVDITLTTDKDVIVHSGGTSSSKTYSVCQCLFIWAQEYPGCVITVAGQDIPNLKKGAYRDAKNIMGDNDYIKALVRDHNSTERIITMKNGSVIEFNSYQDFQDAKSGKRDFLFVNEANGVPYPIYEELQMRTSKKVVIDFNPTAEFWAHEKLKRPDVLWVNSTFVHNPFIDPRVREKILWFKGNDPFRWQVYGLGQLGRLEGLVFNNFKETTEWPEEYKWRLYGLDWGFTNDPTCLIEMRLAHGELYIRQHIYETGLTNQDIAAKLTEAGVDDIIIADSAEPKSIEEVARLGFNIQPSVKGADSINAGINKLKEYKINIYKSPDVLAEFSNYTWQVDRLGKATNKPVDKWNHSIDPARYCITHQKGFIGFV